MGTFSDKWSSATGEQTTTCADDASVCPTADKLKKIQRVEFWGEGASGKLYLEVQSISAESASGERMVSCECTPDTFGWQFLPWQAQCFPQTISFLNLIR